MIRESRVLEKGRRRNRKKAKRRKRIERRKEASIKIRCAALVFHVTATHDDAPLFRAKGRGSERATALPLYIPPCTAVVTRNSIKW